MRNTLSPYLQFNGNCKAAFDYYAEALSTEASVMLYGDIEPPTPQEFKHLVLHASLKHGDNELMGADCVPGFGDPFLQGNNFALNLTLDKLDEAKRIFALLSEGGKVIAPLVQQFVGHIGILEDKFGIKWVVSHPTA